MREENGRSHVQFDLKGQLPAFEVWAAHLHSAIDTLAHKMHQTYQIEVLNLDPELVWEAP